MRMDLKSVFDSREPESVFLEDFEAARKLLGGTRNAAGAQVQSKEWVLRWREGGVELR
ncbi:Uu.00g082690.m01.CDS01 [Anthostomella pinea]|uniref:Uu.00g082690.m01.CDS01 n=1 Tax=Anthostomella pinea TaxID=933095 RepID=A0AAI8YJN6_9PEZI|nr:Uu.00g082690.m01.CDS01 [Anthostomella pinea]